MKVRRSISDLELIGLLPSYARTSGPSRIVRFFLRPIMNAERCSGWAYVRALLKASQSFTLFKRMRRYDFSDEKLFGYFSSGEPYHGSESSLRPVSSVRAKGGAADT